jgi:hypothetical protein
MRAGRADGLRCALAIGCGGPGASGTAGGTRFIVCRRAALGQHRKRACQPQLAGQAALDLAAGCLRQRTGADQDDAVGGDIVLADDGCADRRHDCSQIRLAMLAFDFLDDDEPFLAALVDNGEGGAAVPAQGRVRGLDRMLDVVRIMVDAADNDQILDPAGDEQLARRIDKAEIAGSKPTPGLLACDPSREGRAGGLGVAPVAPGNMGSGDPDLANLARGEAAAALRVDDGDPFADKLATAADKGPSLRRPPEISNVASAMP